MLDNDIRYIDGKAKHWKIGVVNSSGERRYECRVWAFGRKGPTMNISKQAIEAGAKASWENSPGYEWKSLNEIAKESERSDFAAGLTAAMPHLRGEGKQSDCNIQTKNIQSPPEIETQVEIDPDDVQRVARAMWEDERRRDWLFVNDQFWNAMLPEVRKAWDNRATAAIRAMGLTDDFNRGRNDALRQVAEWLGTEMPTFANVKKKIEELKQPGQLFGVWVISEQHWYEHAVGSRFVTTDTHAANVVKSLVSRHYRVDCEVRPYTAPREETAEEIAKRELQDIADNGLRCDTNPTIQITTSANDTALRYVEYIRRIDEGIRDRAKNALKAIREAEKRGESKTERKDP